MNILKKGILSLKKEGVKEFFHKLKKYFKGNEEQKDYKKWIKKNKISQKELEEQSKKKFDYQPKISIIVPLYNTPENYLKELIESVQKQSYSNWELCFADGSTEPLKYLEPILEKENKIKYKILEKNEGISGNTNEALKMATGDFIALLDHDDLLPYNSLYEIVKAINENEGVEYLFTDEDKFTDIHKNTRYEPNFKPDYAFDTLTSYNYICHFSIFSRSLMNQLKGFQVEFNGSQDYDLILRAIEKAKKVVHIPKILYHWRVHPLSVAGNVESKPYAYEAGKKAVKAHLDRLGYTEAQVEYGIAIVRNRAKYPVNKKQEILNVLYLQDARIDLEKLHEEYQKLTYDNYKIALIVEESLIEKEGWEKWEKDTKVSIYPIKKEENSIKKINQIVQKEKVEILLFTKDIQIIRHKDFMEELMGFTQRGNVGVISPRILYQNENTQYNGTIYGIDKEKIGYLDYIDTAGSFGYVTRGAVIENYSIIKSECIMIESEIFHKAGMLDEKMDYEDAFADLSFYLNKRENRCNVIDPHIEIETIQKTKKEKENYFFEKWKKELVMPDPNYNVNLKFENEKLFRIKS